MLRTKDLLGLRGVSAEEINDILKSAEFMKLVVTSNNKKTPHMQGKSVMNVFYENSTRTRISFEIACKFMSGTAANMSATTSSATKGETLIDTAKTLNAMGTDLIVLRHPMTGAPHLMAKTVKAAVINAGDGCNEHPTQGLLDMFTMKEKFGELKGLRVAIVGDILHSRVARSNVYGLATMGASVVLAGPHTLLPADLEAFGCELTDKVDDAVKGADVVMGLRIQLERQQRGLFPSVREYHKYFGLTEKRLALAKEHAMIMHPGPINRGVEIATTLVEGEDAAIDAQVTNGVAVRMALLFMLTRQTTN